jgi:hypothetical protein
VAWPDGAEQTVKLLPGSVRRVEVVVPRVWPTVRVKAAVEAKPEVVSTASGGGAPQMAPVAAEVSVWAWPWPQLVALAGATLLVGAALGAGSGRGGGRGPSRVGAAGAHGVAAARGSGGDALS